MPDEIVTPETPAAAVAEGSAEGKPKDGVQPGSAASAQAEERKFKLKFGKEERELTERELIAQAQKGWAADQKFNEAAQLRKALKDAASKADIDEIVRRFTGKDPDEFYKEKLKSKLRMMTMSPEEKARHEAQQELQKLRSEADELKKAKTEEEMRVRQEHYEQQYDRELSDAVQKNGLPKNRVAIKRAVDLASKVVDMGLEPDWDLVVKEAKRQIVDEMKELFGSYAKDEDLLDLLGEDLPKRLGKAMEARMRVVGKAKAPRVEGERQHKEEERTKPVDMNQWFKDRKKQFEEG